MSIINVTMNVHVKYKQNYKSRIARKRIHIRRSTSISIHILQLKSKTFKLISLCIRIRIIMVLVV